MRILRIRFKNLNSLAGEWNIDLTHPAFASDGIFAITGPTGAGKSTILDAVCLALYGRTPRLSRINKSGNEIMSRQTGECFAEVTFESRSGRFRCHWSQRRARKKPDGELQDPRREIADADSGLLLASHLTDVPQKVESVTGMDFTRFTRSMLLAQGAFSAFLQAAPDERAPILEQITGTEIYSRISIRVHERLREEREKLRLLRAESAGIRTLEPEREAEIRLTLESRRKEEAGLAALHAETGKALAWRAGIALLEKEIAAMADEDARLQSEYAAFGPEGRKLERALGAASLDGAYAALTAVRKEQTEDRLALKDGDEKLPSLEKAAREQADELARLEKNSARAKKERQEAAPLLRQVRSLDQKLAGQQKELAGDGERRAKEAAAIAAAEQDRNREEAERAKAAADMERAVRYLSEHARDAWLAGGLAGVEEIIRTLLSRQEELRERDKEFARDARLPELAAKKLEECRAHCLLRKRDLDNAAERLQRAKKQLEQVLERRSLREYRAEKEGLLRETALLARIAELKGHRARLEDGKPCPLCGATDHPFAWGNIPAPDEIEKKIAGLTAIINKAEELEAAIGADQEAEILARASLAEAETRESSAALAATAAAKDLAERRDILEKLRAALAEREKELEEKLRPLGLPGIPQDDPAGLLPMLQARLAAWRAWEKKREEAAKRITGLSSEISGLDAALRVRQAALAEEGRRLEDRKKALAQALAEREALYGGKNPDDEEANLEKAASLAEAAEKKARALHDGLRDTYNAARAQAESLRARLALREPELAGLEAAFALALAPLDFSGEQEFLAARLPAGQRARLAAKAGELEERRTDIKVRQKDRLTRLEAEKARKLSGESPEELAARLTECEKALEGLRDAVGELKSALRDNQNAGEKLREKGAAIDRQNTEYRRWENLHELIGSADGKKYRNFAQGLTFEIMVGHANRQLRHMSDRYLLIRDEAQPLELNVIDGYQAGEIRSTKNLSGGESFIVSLSLALGLSRMSGKIIRVDSLFLDEGFGTLDEEALDTALETLAALRRDGKLIGIISHIPALNERIAARIRVRPQSGGKSLISGPGCSGPKAGQKAGTRKKTGTAQADDAEPAPDMRDAQDAPHAQDTQDAPGVT